jgi:hypothetical protein
MWHRLRCWKYGVLYLTLAMRRQQQKETFSLSLMDISKANVTE